LISVGVWGSIYVYSSFPGLHPDLFGFAPPVNERDSLWANPRAAATSWKPCAERRSDEISDLVLENDTSGYIFIHAEGGLNQQRIAVYM
jgi:hypothetical protein